MSEVTKNKIIEWLLIIAVVYLFIMIPKGTTVGNYVRYYKSWLLNFIPLIILILSLFRPQSISLRFGKFDGLFLGFIGFHFLSFFWAITPSEIWPTSINWLWIYAFYKIVSSLHLKLHYDYWYKALLLVLIINLIQLSYFYIDISLVKNTSGLTYDSLAEFRKYFFYHINYHSANMAILFPFYFLLLKRYKTSKTYKTGIIILILIHSFYLLLMNARGSSVALLSSFIILSSFYFPKLSWRKTFTSISLIIGIFLFLFIVVKNDSEFLNQYNPLKGITTSEEITNDRIDLWNKTLQLNREHFFLGVGVGNWKIAYPKHGVDELTAGFDKIGIHVHAHSIFFQTLGELGVLGLLLFISLLLYISYSFRRIIALDKEFYRIFLAIFISYIIVNFFYGARPYSPALSFTFIAFLLAYLQIIRRQNTPFAVSRFTIHSYFVLTLILSFISLNIGYQFVKLKQKKQEHIIAKAIKNKQYTKAIALIDQLYHPYFYTLSSSMPPISLKAKKANILWEQDKQEQAILNYKLALKNQPYNHKVWFDYGEKLFQKDNLTAAKSILLKSYKINKNYFKTSLLLAQIAIKNKEYEAAEQWLLPVEEIAVRIDDLCKKKKNRIKIQTCRKFKGYQKQIEILRQKMK